MSQRLRKSEETKNSEGFGFVDVVGKEWVGHINLFWKDFPLALVPPPIATEIRAALILARENGDRTGASAVAAYLDLPCPAPAVAQATANKRQHFQVAGQTILIANKGTRDELTITAQADGTYQIDNSFVGGSKSWVEFPRPGKTIAACKATASRIFGEPQAWEFQE